MKFGDKLIALRKKKKLSQEELAEKLGVSRQSVSKWESGSTYPETDKIVQICNIFDCTMDDLINDNITDLETIERKNKNNINIIFDSFLDFITKTINMFSSMKFTSGSKCIIEMFVLFLILLVIGLIIVDVLSSILSSIFSFLPNNEIIFNIFKSIFSLIYMIIMIIILVHVFKIRYLNYYDEINNKNNNHKTNDKNTNNKINIKENKERIIIRNEKDRPFAFLSILSKIIIIFVKAFAFMILLGFTIFLVCFSFLTIFSLVYAFDSLMFLGFTIMFLSSLVINVIIILLLTKFIFNKEFNHKIVFIIFLTFVIILGIGIGISAISLKNVKLIDNMDDILDLKWHDEIINYQDNLIIYSYSDNIYSHSDKIIYEIDNNIENNKIKLSINYDNNYNKFELYYDYSYKMNVANLIVYEKNQFNTFNTIINDIKKGNIRDYNFNYYDVKVYANEETIKNLMNNLNSLYNYDYDFDDNQYKIYNVEYKIDDHTGDTCSYDAKNKTMNCGKYNDKCYIDRRLNNDKESIELTCDY